MLHVEDIRTLSNKALLAETRYLSMAQQHSIEASHFQQLRQEWLEQGRQLEDSKMSSSQELDSSQTAVDILRRENKELQTIFGAEIERRNATIRELVVEKKALFSQLVGR